MLMAVALVACHQPDILREDARPDWRVQPNGNESVNMTALCVLQMQDPTSPHSPLPVQDGDMLAAMLDGRICAMGYYEDGYYFLTIPAPSNQTGNVTFSFYSVSHKHIYTIPESIPYQTDAIHGSFENPVVLHLIP